MDNANNCNNSESDQSDSHSPGSPKICYGCKMPIEDEYRFRVSPDLEWHASCLVCSECQVNLDENCTCFLKEGRPYCRKDYVLLFGVKCSSCLQTISGTDSVMRAKDLVYHMHCFCCSSCEKHLVPGENFGVSSGKLFCKSDYDLLQQHEPLDSPTDLSDPSCIENYNSSNGNDDGTNSSHIPINGSSNGSSGGTTKRSNSEKGPRIRTVLSEQQLQTLRTVYATNPRPDALMKEHLVEITGLSPRVIRVWFQNKRCKDKKKAIQHEAACLQQQQQQHQAMQVGSNSILPPLTPQTPLTPDSMGQISPHSGMAAFTYPPAPGGYESIQPMPTTPTPTVISPIVTYQQNPAWSSPTSTIPHFDPNVDYPTPMTTGSQQSFVHSTAITSNQNNGFY